MAVAFCFPAFVADGSPITPHPGAIRIAESRVAPIARRTMPEGEAQRRTVGARAEVSPLLGEAAGTWPVVTARAVMLTVLFRPPGRYSTCLRAASPPPLPGPPARGPGRKELRSDPPGSPALGYRPAPIW